MSDDSGMPRERGCWGRAIGGRCQVVRGDGAAGGGYTLRKDATNPLPARNLAISTPTITFESLTFSDGTKIDLGPNDVVVFVGPNNAGKSQALRELEEHLNDTQETTVLQSLKTRRDGTAEEFGTFLRQHAQITNRGSGIWHYSGYGFSASDAGMVEDRWPDHIRVFRSLFCMSIPTKTRITDSDSPPAIAILDDPISHPIHMLYADDQLEHKISSYFRRAFGEDLILHRAGGSKVPLYVGNRPSQQQGEDRVSVGYLNRLLASAVPLHKQGDGMRSFASVLLHVLAPISPSILLLDEPEAFLHPPQARLLGELIATERSPRAQLFLATHSPDVLHGLIDVAPKHLRVLRIQRRGNVNHVKELDNDLVRKISTNPLMKYSSVMSGVFHARVIICESDADCMFYSSLLDLRQVHGDRQPDVLFVHGNGTGRMAALVKTLVALDVPVDVIADMDVIKNDEVFRRTIDELHGNWGKIKPLVKKVKAAIEQQMPLLKVSEIEKSIRELLDEPTPATETSRSLDSKIRNIFSESSPWSAIKRSGQAAIPSGDATKHFQELQSLCREASLWLVPVGEMEGFCKSVSDHGPTWVQQVMEGRDLANDPDLEHARQFVREIWDSKH